MKNPVLGFIVLVALLFVATPSWAETRRAAPPMYVAFHWHMHQPIYWPYEPITQTAHNPNCTDAVIDYLTWPDRVGAYTHFPVDTIRGNLGLPHVGAQISFSGSLIEDLNDLARAGQGYGRDWAATYREARSWKTADGNPRLDLVAFGYHHPLMGLIDYEDTRRQIAAHRRILLDTFGGAPSKGIFPPENAFSERMIPALVDEGLEWAMVDNLHFDRANRDYPWSPRQVMVPPNEADQRNPAQPAYLDFTCQQNTVNAVSPGFGLRPHWAQYVDPSTGRALTPDGRVARMVVVPTERSMGYDDSYGDRDPIDRLQKLEAYNTDPEHPLLVVLAHDGDNAGASGSRYYLETCRWVSRNPDRFVLTTVQDYLDRFPPAAHDIIHVEDGSWTGADIGDMEFKKWNGDPYAAGQIDHENGYSPDRNSWAVVTAAKNRVMTASQVAPGTPQAEGAWWQFMVSETSCYWYWDGTYEWDLKPTIACNNAVAAADPILQGPFEDRTPPTVFIPQREPYNPGGREWDKAVPRSRTPWALRYGGGEVRQRLQPSDFMVWTLAYDVSGLERVTLNYRVAQGQDVTAANLVYDGGTWVRLPMEGRVIPDVSSSLATARYKAEEYRARVEGLSDCLVDYYVEAVDGRGNVARSPLCHVFVGRRHVQPEIMTPPRPTLLDAITIRSGAPGKLHWGVNGWTLPDASFWPPGTVAWTDGKAVETPLAGPDENGFWSVTVGPFGVEGGVEDLDFVFHHTDGTWGTDQTVHLLPSALRRGLAALTDELVRVERSARRLVYVGSDPRERRAARAEWERLSRDLAGGTATDRRRLAEMVVKLARRSPELERPLSGLARQLQPRVRD